MTCETCKFFQNSECHRFPPTVTGFQVVSAGSWCGEHRTIEVEKEVEPAPKLKTKWIK